MNLMFKSVSPNRIFRCSINFLEWPSSVAQLTIQIGMPKQKEVDCGKIRFGVGDC
jgi:hypothetical protein